MAKTHSDMFDAPVNVKRLIEKLQLDEDNLEEAALESARLTFEAGRYRVIKMRKRARASLAYDMLFAERRLRGRKKKDEDGRKSFTEGAVSDLAQTSPEVATAKRDLDEAFAAEEVSKILLECYRIRRDMIKGIAQIRGAEISNELRSVRENMKHDEMDKLRKNVRARFDTSEEEEEEQEG
jgi:hypothetical protein